MEAPPSSYDGFLGQFQTTASEGGGGDKSHDAKAAKRQKVLASVNGDTLSAPVARYALGGDDNLYVQLGLSVLHTAMPERALAPSALYNVDAVHAIRDGIRRSVVAELKQRKSESGDKLKLVFDRLRAILDGTEMYKRLNLRFSDFFETAYEDSKAYTFKEVLLHAQQILENVTAFEFAFDFKDDPLTVTVASDPVVEASIVDYAISRGLCGHRGPMEPPTDAPTDGLLTYSAPKGIFTQLARAGGLKLPKGASKPPRTSKASDTTRTAAVEEAREALGGNYAIDDASPTQAVVKDARQVRWLPVGKHAAALARTAALEHAAARCGQVLDATGASGVSGLSPAARAELEDAQACLKLIQLDSLHELACAAEDGEALHHVPETPLVTRPVATIRGKVHIAHDAGHYAAPSTTTVPADERWTTEHVRANAAFRAESTTGASSQTPRYKAPAPHALGYLAAPMAVGASNAPPYLVDPVETIPRGSVVEGILQVVEYGLYYADVPDAAAVEATLNGPKPSDALSSAETRRSGIWNEMLRDIAVSTDRLWTFVRTLSGLIGEDADSLLITADAASETAAKELQAQRKATADRVAALHSKLLESLVGSLLKESGLKLTTDATEESKKLVVVDSETAKQMSDLASGESGRPFFEANVALRALADRASDGKYNLGEVVSQLNEVVQQLHAGLDAEAQAPQTAGTSLAELSMPRNSYFVKLRADTTAAIRSAFDTFTVESSVKGVGKITLWELVEGADATLSTRFADFVGHVLIQNRTSTGVSALYTSRQQLVVNASQAGNALQRLVNHARHYRGTVAVPDYGSDSDDLKTLRDAYFASAPDGTSSWASGAAAKSILYAQERHFKHVERVARPGDPVPQWLRPWVQGLHS